MAAPAQTERTAASKPSAAVKQPPSPRVASPAPALNNAPPAVTLGSRVAPDEIDLSSGQLAVSNAEQLKDGESVDLKARLPGLAEGTIRVWKSNRAFHTRGAGSAILLAHPILSRLGAPTVLVLQVKADVITGYVTMGAPGVAKGKDRALFQAISKGADALNWLGLTNISLPNVTNEFSGGALSLGADGMHFKVGGFLDGTGSFAITGKDLSLEGGATINVPGGTVSTLSIKRDPKGALSGTASVPVKVGGVTGTVTGELSDGFVRVMGTVAYASDKLSGSVTLIATDEATARDLTLQKPSAGQIPQLDAEAAKTNKPGRRAFCGFGELSFQINEWLAGTAQVVVNSKGQATIIGEIAPPKEFILFEQRDWHRRLFKVEARAGYGIPVVGEVFVFASAELTAKASVGPGKLYNIKLSGVYSTDQRVTKELTLEASLNISAFAGLIVRAEGGVGITIIGHDIKAGVGIDATAGVRGYVEATPKIGMRQAPGQKTQYFIAGHMEIAAQPFLGLGGDLFVSVETPWWSPLSDKTWKWPLFSLEYPLPGEFGIGADVNYLLGSRQWPEVSFGDVDFDASKFTTDIMSDSAPKGKGGEQKKAGKWKEGTGADSLESKGGGAGRAGKGQGGVDGFSGPIGEKVSFSDGGETHTLWIAEKAGDAVPMAASQQGPVSAKLDELETDIGDADPADQAKARAVLPGAKAELAKLGKESQQLAAIKAASENAKRYYETTAKKQSKGSKGNKPDPRKLGAAVKSDEHKLAKDLGVLATLTLRVPFKQIERKAEMEDGTEPILMHQKEDQAKLRVAGGEGAAKLVEIQAGPLSKNHTLNPAGRNLAAGAEKNLTKLAGMIGGAKVRKRKINARVLKKLDTLADGAAGAVSKVGKQMKIKKLARALERKKIPKGDLPPLEFEGKPGGQGGSPADLYRKRFLIEMKRQIKRQQEGLNELTVDQWIANLVRFSMNEDTFKELDREARLVLGAELIQRATEAQAKAATRRAQLLKWQAQKKADAASLQRRIEDIEKELANNETKQNQLATALLELNRTRARIEAGIEGVAPLRNVLAPIEENAKQSEFVRRARLAIIGRLGGERTVRDKIAKDLVLLEQDNQQWEILFSEDQRLAVLHNPDQVAGGYDLGFKDIPKRPKDPPNWSDPQSTKEWKTYLEQLKKLVGPQVVNGQIGRAWKAHIKAAVPAVKAKVPEPAYGINMLNFTLKVI